MPVQMRLSQSDNRFYSPDRDLAYCSPHLVHRAMLGLDPENQEPWIREYMRENNITPDDLVTAAHVLAAYMNKTLTDPIHKEPFDALTAAGFFALDRKLQVIVCSKIGQVFLSAMFSSIRDVTRKPETPSYNTKEIADAAAHLLDSIHAYNSTPTWRRKLREFWRRWFGA